MSYTPPAYNAANVSWVGEPAYSSPAWNAANVTWAPTVLVGQVSAPSPLGFPKVGGFVGELPDGVVLAPGPLSAPSLHGAPVIVGRMLVASPLASAATVGHVVVGCRASAPSPLAMPWLVGAVVRYELRGEVRDQGVLVNRRVRAYRRSTGALVAEADTIAGLFALPVGFTADEYYLVPINLDAAATDFAPPCANRVTSVLAMDPG